MEVEGLALERLEEIAREIMDLVGKYNLTYDEMFYTLNYVERMLQMDMIEEMLEDYGLITFEEEDDNG
ncbi:MAG: hypothetical protein M1169_02260 [Firmicutes bacterium]|jgi:hypothetical protein|nr:hypothetical protein [Bacillota bacterium]